MGTYVGGAVSLAFISAMAWRLITLLIMMNDGQIDII